MVSIVPVASVHGEMVRSLSIAPNRQLSARTINLRLLAIYGFEAPTVCRTFNDLILYNYLPTNGKVHHLLYFLAYMKTYAPFEVYVTMFNVASSTFREWVWKMAKAIASMEHIIVWDNRFDDDNGSTCKITLDGVDCPIDEPQPFDKKWFSHKYKCAGLRYEIGVCIQTGHIVWKNGPYECGDFPDIKIARDWLHDVLPAGEKYLADGGYRDGGVHSETPTGYRTPGQYMKKVARARHETANQRLKKFAVLAPWFRNPLEKHWYCFHALANMTQLDIEHEHPLFQIIYDDKNIL